MYTKIVFLVRHAESRANAGERTDDPSSTSLTLRGRQQAATVKNALNPQPNIVIVSSFRRTRETAEPLLDSMPWLKESVWPVHEFCYLDTVKCAGTDQYERAKLRVQYWERMDPNFIDGIGAESFSKFITRIDRTMVRLHGIRKDPIAIFTHGLFIEGMILRVRYPNISMVETMKMFYNGMESGISNASVTEMIVTKGGVFIGRTLTDHVPSDIKTK